MITLEDCVGFCGLTEEEVLAPVQVVLRYDVAAWLANGAPKDPTPYRLYEPTEFEFRLTAEAEDGLRAAIRVWTMRVQGLAKLVTRVNLGWLARECHRVGESQASMATLTGPPKAFSATVG